MIERRGKHLDGPGDQRIVVAGKDNAGITLHGEFAGDARPGHRHHIYLDACSLFN